MIQKKKTKMKNSRLQIRAKKNLHCKRWKLPPGGVTYKTRMPMLRRGTQREGDQSLMKGLEKKEHTA